MGDHHAEHGVAEELQALVRLESSAGPLIDVGGMDESRFKQRGVAERGAKRPGKGGRHERRSRHWSYGRGSAGKAHGSAQSALRPPRCTQYEWPTGMD